MHILTIGRDKLGIYMATLGSGTAYKYIGLSRIGAAGMIGCSLLDDVGYEALFSCL